MARQKSVIRIEGSVGNLSFYTDKVNGGIVRQKGGPSKDQIKNLPSCKEVRQNNTEFGKASRAGKLFREGFYQLLHHCPDPKFSRRLQSKLLEVLKQDRRHKPGSRVLQKENFRHFGLLELHGDFESSACFSLPVERQVDEVQLSIEVKIDTGKQNLKSATHFRVISSAAGFDFNKMKKEAEVLQSPLQAIENRSRHAFVHHLKKKGIIFHGLCIVFYQQVNEEFYLLNESGMSRGWIECVW